MEKPWFSADRLPKLIVWAGIIIRVGVFLTLWPDNSDAHSEVIRFILSHHRLPFLTEAHEAYSPPLYYLLGVPFLAGNNLKSVQLLSLMFSNLTMLVFYRLIYGTAIIRGDRARLYCTILVALLPQFVLFSLFISNDTMAFFLGALTLLQAYKFARSPNWKELSLLSIATGLGLLTKAVFLAFLPVLALLVFLVFVRSDGAALRKASLAAAAFLLIAGALGCYKYVDNYVVYRNPTINPMDENPDWAVQQRKLYRGWASYSDINIARLVRYPLFGDRNDWGYPVLFYASFWYPNIRDSSFAIKTPLRSLGSLIYLFAPLPTAVFLVGLWVFLSELWRLWRKRSLPDPDSLTLYAAGAILLCNVALLLDTEVKYHVWSIIQSRLLFPSFFGSLVIFAEGVRLFDSRRVLRLALAVTMAGLAVLFVAYFCAEIGLNADAARDTLRAALPRFHP